MLYVKILFAGVIIHIIIGVSYKYSVLRRSRGSLFIDHNWPIIKPIGVWNLNQIYYYFIIFKKNYLF